MSCSIVVARSKNNVIGREQAIPWHAKGEQGLFKRITIGGTLIMGRKTFESIGRPLPDRETVIVTRNPDYEQGGCHTASGFDEALEIAKSISRPIHVVGGGEIYRLALPIVGIVHLSTIQMEVDGDTFFPPFPTDDFIETGREYFESNVDFLYQRFEKVSET
ncbi:MAG: dihydrofolate reductase [Gammaproteobacteria bacterium]|nr:dihydrofolate reductase [Gammaproteobacteria bacterium]